MTAPPSDHELQHQAQALRKRGLIRILLLLTGLVSLTFWLESQQADLRVAALAYEAPSGWFLANDEPWRWLYRWGTVPAFVVLIAVLFFWYRGLRDPRLARWRPYLLVYALVPILGAGILVNTLLKEHTGRPRPREVVEFGGPWQYRPPLTLGIAGKGRSFPCGHCTMGFVFSTGIVFWNRSRKLAIGMLVGGMLYGGLMSAARIVQGGHFLTDALWAWGSLWLVMVILYDWILQPPVSEHRLRPLTEQTKKRVGWGLAAFMGVMLVLYLTRRPFYADYRRDAPLPEGITQIEVNSPIEAGRWKVEAGPEGTLELFLEARGFALPDAQHRLTWQVSRQGETLTLELATTQEGYFAELGEEVILKVPEALRAHVQLPAPSEGSLEGL